MGETSQKRKMSCYNKPLLRTQSCKLNQEAFPITYLKLQSVCKPNEMPSPKVALFFQTKHLPEKSKMTRAHITDGDQH